MTCRKQAHDIAAENLDSSDDDGAGSDDAMCDANAAMPVQPPTSDPFFAKFLEAFARSQAEANRALIETLRGLPLNDGVRTSSSSAMTSNCMPVAMGNFSRCTARFDGKSQDAEILEAFIDAIEIYKECAGVSDEHAIRGLPMLLEGDAAVWWRGAKVTVRNWKEALERLRAVYGVPKPAYKVFREVFFTRANDNERADVLVCRVRALLSRLPYDLPEVASIDIIYGLLHKRVRKRLTRDSVSTLDQLLDKVRTTEDAICELRNETIVAPITLPPSDILSNVHNINNESKTNDTGVVGPMSNVSTTNKKERPKCSYCKKYGHVVNVCKHLGNDDVNNVRSKSLNPVRKSSENSSFDQSTGIRCYGCGKRGVVRSKCDVCSSVTSNHLKRPDFNSIHLGSDDGVTCPVISLDIFGKQGVAVVDTGATNSIASPSLYRILLNNNVKFQAGSVIVRLADGSRRSREVLSADVPVTLEGRCIDATFLVLPGEDTRTLVGFDFMTKANMVLHPSQGMWLFADNPERRYSFVQTQNSTNPSETLSLRIEASDLSLREDEGSNLTMEQRQTLDQFIKSRASQFAEHGPATDFAIHRIKVSDEQEPIASPPYRMSQSRRQALKGELDKLLEQDIIEECESPWASNVVLVTKKNGSLRLCIDYRKLNAVTEPDRYPLPRVEDILHAAKTCKYMTTLDLKSGYFQVSVLPSDRDKTAFITPTGTFRFKRMPMGLRNSGATFQRLIDRFKSNLGDVAILGYLDDLIVLSPDSFEKHMTDLAAVFDRLAMFCLRVNRHKSCFARDSVKFLGHVIVPGGIHVDPDKVSAITSRTAPQTVKQLKCFLQTTSWFRRFVPNYAEVARPLTNLLKKNAEWQWDVNQSEAFERLKYLLITAPILKQADESKPFILRTDSSGYCLGAALMQGEGLDERPVEYASRLLTDPEKNYTTTEREALAVVWAVGKFRGYLEGADIVVKSDHQPLRWLMSLRSPSGRLARWALALQEHNLKIEYTPGRANLLADTLSRPPVDESHLRLAVVDMPARSKSDIRNSQLQDPEVRKIVEDMEADDPFRGRPWSDRGYVLSDGILYRYNLERDDAEDACLVVPQQEREKVLSDFHDAPTAGHFGIERTFARIASRFYWPGMRRCITDYIKNCVSCQRYKADNKKPAGLCQSPAMTRRFEVLSIDLFGPLVVTPQRNRWILIVEDVCSRWVELFPLENATSTECAKVLINEVFLRYGVPRRLISDNGVQFVSEVMQQLCHAMGIDQALTPLYHPEANPVERKNRDLKSLLAILVGQRHSTWDTHIAAVRFAMNSAITASTGFSPAYLTFGRELRAPSDAATDMKTILDADNFIPAVTPYLKGIAAILAEARDTHERSQATQKKFSDDGRRVPPNYQLGDLVLLRTHGLNDTGKAQTVKFIPRRDGPYKIAEVLSNTTYRLESLENGDSLGKYHVSHLTPFVGQVEPPIREKRRRGRPRKLIDAVVPPPRDKRRRGRPCKSISASPNPRTHHSN